MMRYSFRPAVTGAAFLFALNTAALAADDFEAAMASVRDGIGDCTVNELPEGLETVRHPLGEDHMLHLVPCWSGAYNLGTLVFVTGPQGEAMRQFFFVGYSPEGETTEVSPVLVNAWFDEESATLASFDKARGLGDCGSTGTWRWEDGAFALLEFRARECSDGEALGPDDWPVVYQTDRP